MADVTMSDRDVQDLGAFRYLGSTPGELAKKISDLERDNQKFRDKIKGLEDSATKAPPEGAVVLTGDETTEYAAWKELALKPADVATLKKERDDLAAKDATRTRQDLLTAARDTEGWNENAPKALLKLAGFDAVELTAGEVTVERTNGGKKENVKAPTAFVTVDGKQVRISEWLAKEAPEFIPLLTVQTNGKGGGAASDGIIVHEARGSGGGSSVKTDEDFRKATVGTAQYDTF